jgi:Flp pilus assembly protein TadG
MQLLSRGREPTSARRCLGRFASHERGTIAILYALLAIPTLGIVFGGIDYSRALSVQDQFQTAAEAAARVAASRLHEGPSTAATAFRAAFRSNLPDDLKNHPYDLNIARDASSVSVEITASVPTTLVAMVGLNKLDIVAGATAKPPLPGFLAVRKAHPNPLDVPTGGAAGVRARSELERAIRRGGATNARLPSDDEIVRARRRLNRALREMGHAGLPTQLQGLPDAAELERKQRQIQRELGRLRF